MGRVKLNFKERRVGECYCDGVCELDYIYFYIIYLLLLIYFQYILLKRKTLAFEHEY